MKADTTEILQYIIGTDNLSFYIAKIFFAFIGIALLLLSGVVKRNPMTSESPVHFEFIYMLRDNWKRIVSSVILVFIFIRFPEVINFQFSSPVWELIYAFGIGLGSDQLSVWLKKFNVLGK